MNLLSRFYLYALYRLGVSACRISLTTLFKASLLASASDVDGSWSMAPQ